MTATTIRQLTEDDAVAYLALRLNLLHVSPDAYGTTHAEMIARPASQTAERLRAQQDPEVGFTIGAFAGELVGMVTILREKGTKRRHRGAVVGMGVAEAARGQGVGRSLLTAAIESARLLDGLEQLILTVALPNEPALRLYRALGFVTYSVDRRSLKLNERHWDEELMVLAL